MVINDSLLLTSVGLDRPTWSDLAIGRRFQRCVKGLRIHFAADFSLNPERLFPEGDLRFGSR